MTTTFADVRRGTAFTGVLVGANAVILLVLLTAGWPVALALAVLGPAAFAVVHRPQRGLLLLVALAPFNGLLLLVDEPPLAAGWKEALVLATLGATFVCPAEARGAPGRRLPGWWPAVALLVVLGLVSGVAFVGGLDAVIGLKVSFFYLFVLVALWRCPFDQRDRDRLVTVLMTTGFVTALFGVAQQVLGHQRLAAMGFPYNDTIRFAGSFLRSFSTFSQPFGFGFYAMVVLLVCVPVALTDLQRLRNRLFLLAVPLIGLGMLTTIVRGAWLGFAVGFAWIASSRHRWFLLLIPVGLVSVLFLPPEVADSALSSSSTEQRAEGWLENLDRVTASPLGVGIGTSGSAAEKADELRGGRGETYQSDNYYFRTVYELGVLGLWLFLLALAAIHASLRRAAGELQAAADRGRADAADAALATGTVAMILAVAAASLVANYLEIFPLDVLFWLLIGVVETCRQQRTLLPSS